MMVTYTGNPTEIEQRIWVVINVLTSNFRRQTRVVFLFRSDVLDAQISNRARVYFSA